MLNLICFELTTSGLGIHFRSLRFSQKTEDRGKRSLLGLQRKTVDFRLSRHYYLSETSERPKITVIQIKKAVHEKSWINSLYEKKLNS